MKQLLCIIGIGIFCMPFVGFGQIRNLQHFDKLWVRSGSVSFDGGIHLKSKEGFIPADLMQINNVEVDTSQSAKGGVFYKEAYVQVKKPSKEGFYLEQGGFASDTFICYVRLLKNITVYAHE